MPTCYGTLAGGDTDRCSISAAARNALRSVLAECGVNHFAGCQVRDLVHGVGGVPEREPQVADELDAVERVGAGLAVERIDVVVDAAVQHVVAGTAVEFVLPTLAVE